MAPEPELYNGYKLFHFGDGFTDVHFYSDGSNGTLYLLTHFIATKDDTLAYGFSFGANSMGWSLHGGTAAISKEAMATTALETVKVRLDAGDLEDRKHYAYGYNFDEMKFEPRDNPIWRALPAQ